MTFVQIRSDLTSITSNPAVTVPTIELPDGSFVTDSWKIAQFLDLNFPDTPSLFARSESMKHLSQFLIKYVETVIYPTLAPLVMLRVVDALDEPSATYCREVKLVKVWDSMIEAAKDAN